MHLKNVYRGRKESRKSKNTSKRHCKDVRNLNKPKKRK